MLSRSPECEPWCWGNKMPRSRQEDVLVLSPTPVTPTGALARDPASCGYQPILHGRLFSPWRPASVRPALSCVIACEAEVIRRSEGGALTHWWALHLWKGHMSVCQDGGV
ncbi:hypothetical protein EYF80_041708 [Liparis tanakae]|uniref:Uncharacterized protein n=1 Tax=Liparis tanakae TaxID=230148 RepID=A0A4Z2G5C5_9TELE|nr:hypothetical protein EYF80_041708 [Liparis tanakae]